MQTRARSAQLMHMLKREVRLLLPLVYYHSYLPVDNSPPPVFRSISMQTRARSTQLMHMLKTAASVAAAVVSEPSLPPPFAFDLSPLDSPDAIGFQYEV